MNKPKSELIWHKQREVWYSPTGFCSKCYFMIKRLKTVCPNEYAKAVAKGLIKPI